MPTRASDDVPRLPEEASAEAAVPVWLRQAEVELRAFMGHNLVFLVGAPRSGTTWLQRLIASHPRVRTGQESRAFDAYLGLYLRTWNAEVERRTRPGLAARPGVGLGAYLRREDVVDCLRFTVAKMMAAAGLRAGEVFLEKSPGHATYVSEIKAVFPDARFIHIHRDPRDVIGSMLVASRSWGRDWAPHAVNAAVDRWARSIRAVRESKQEIGGEDFFEVTYGDLRVDPASVLRTLAPFLGLPWAEEEIQQAIMANGLVSVQSGGGTPIPLYGLYRDHFGPEVVEPVGFAGGSAKGRGWESLSLSTRIAAWRRARHLAGQEGYPADFRSWAWSPRHSSSVR
jgi:LPS sulfotransferase NodH